MDECQLVLEGIDSFISSLEIRFYYTNSSYSHKPSSDCSSSNYSEKVNEDELLRWVQNILRHLLCFAAQDYVPSYFMPKCHQPVWLKERYLKQFHMRLYRHGLLTYTDLFSLNEQ